MIDGQWTMAAQFEPHLVSGKHGHGKLTNDRLGHLFNVGAATPEWIILYAPTVLVFVSVGMEITLS